MVNIFTDGGARGNPGPAAIGVYITDGDKNKLFAFGQKIGEATNNVAEYTAVLYALDFILGNKGLLEDGGINFFLDSELVVRQLNGIYKIKNEKLFGLFSQIKAKELKIKNKIHYSSIPREQNREADKMVNMSLDNKLEVSYTPLLSK